MSAHSRLAGRPPAGSTTTVDALIEGAPDAVIAIDAGGRISRWNRRAVEVFGWATEEALGRRVRDLIVPEAVREAHEEGLRRAVVGGPTRLLGRAVEVDALRRDGTTVPVELTISRVEVDEEVAFVAFLRDITLRRQAEAAMDAARETFRLAFRDAPIGITLTALHDFSYLDVNPALCEMLGYSREELLATSFPALTHPDDRDTTMDLARRLRAGELETYRVEKRYLRKDRSVLWVDLSVSILRGPAGEPRCYLAQVVDISDRKATDEALRASERRLADAQAVAHVGSWERDVETGRVVWSEELLRIFGLGADQVPQSAEDYLALVHPDDRGMVAEAIDTLPGEQDYRIVRPDGEVRWVHGRRGVVSGPGEPLRIAGTLHDVTDRKRVEEELRRSNAALEQYAHAASHDLASPLTTIGGFASMLMLRHRDALPADAQGYLDAIVRGTERMRSMLDAMLAYSRAQGGERVVEEVDLAQLTAEVLDDLRATIADTDAEVTVGELPTVPGERALLRQVVLNLLTNALKFTRPGEAPQVEVGATRGQACWEVSVADRGIGIPPGEAERAFGMFTRLSSTSEYAGTGMGLALCQKVVERHEGRIWVDATPGGGTTVRFTLPA